MTVGAAGHGNGRLLTVTLEAGGEVPVVDFAEQVGAINADLTIGSSPDAAQPLRANERVASPGVKLHGAGFIVDPARALSLGLGKVPGLDRHIRLYCNGRDMTGHSRDALVIDLFGLTEPEARRRFHMAFQHVLLNVKPARDMNQRESYRRKWWLFGEPRSDIVAKPRRKRVLSQSHSRCRAVTFERDQCHGAPRVFVGFEPHPRRGAGRCWWRVGAPSSVSVRSHSATRKGTD